MNSKIKLTNALLLSAGISAFLIFVRIGITNNLTYIFLIWNLFLAWMPLLITSIMQENKSWFYRKKNKYWLFPIIGIWLLFFPNAPYIVTDLVHLSGKYSDRFWFDLFLIFWFAFTGLAVGMISMFRIHQIITVYFGNVWGWLTVISSSLLAGYGVYLGRILRWNSWDVFIDPIILLKESLLTLTDRTALIMTFLLGMLLIGIYYLFMGLLHYQPEKMTDNH